MKRVVIVGGGISGLTTAYRLRQRQPDLVVTLLEAAPQAGGCVQTRRRAGFTVEAGPNGFLDSKPATLSLSRELGLADQLVDASESSARERYVFLRNRLHALPAGPRSLLTTPLLSWRGKFELLAEPLRPRGRRRVESVQSMAQRRIGREAATVFVDALVTGIHGGDPALLDVRAAFPRVAAAEAEAGSVVRGFARAARLRRAEAQQRGESPPSRQRLWSFRHGLQTLITALVERLGSRLRTNTAALRVTHLPSGWQVATNAAALEADALVLACPPAEQAVLLASVDAELATAIGGIASNRIAVVAVGFAEADVPQRFNGFGYIAPQNTRRDVLGVQWCSAIYPDRAPPGQVLWRALCGGWHRAEVVDWPDDRLLTAVRHELRLATGVRAEPTFVEIVRWPRAIPQYLLGHPERVARIERQAGRWPGLFLTGNAYHGVALNDCVEQGEQTAQRVADFLGSVR